MNTDPLADFLIRIKNGQAVSKKTVSVPHSRLKEALAKIIVKEGYLVDYKVVKIKNVKTLELTLKYHHRRPAMNIVKRVSKPGRRLYTDKAGLKKIMVGPGIVILSTSKGVMTAKDALKKGIGGEIICQIL